MVLRDLISKTVQISDWVESEINGGIKTYKVNMVGNVGLVSITNIKVVGRDEFDIGYESDVTDPGDVFESEDTVFFLPVSFFANADEDENEFETGAMTNENLLNARNAYRVQKGLLTSDEIVAIRESYGLSQVDLAKLLGWGEATISRYESKAIQDEAYDTMLRLVKDNPLQALEFLKKNSDKFNAIKRNEIRSKIVEKLDSYGKEFLTRQAFEGEYANFEEPCDSNGYTTLNIDKLEAAISYIAESTSYLFKVKLMKMLWYSDVVSFIKNGFAMTGLVYRHEPMGALPIGHYSLMNLERLNVQEEVSSTYDSMLHVYPTKDMDYSIFTDDEKETLNLVIEKFKTYKANEIVDYMHEEKAYNETKAGEIIPFSLAKEIRAL